MKVIIDGPDERTHARGRAYARERSRGESFWGVIVFLLMLAGIFVYLLVGL